ncbi:MAG: recombinase family protein [Thermoplasmataceae archaeon]
MTLAFGYVRASTTEEVRQGSNERQKEILERFFKDRGWEYRIYEDKAKSGANMEREDFKRMEKEIDALKPHAIVVTKIDRYARSLIDLLNSIQQLEQKGVGFISVQDSGIDTTSPNGRLLLQILGAFAEFERTMINSRTSAGREKAKAKGVKFGRPSLKTSKFNGGKYIDPKKVMEFKEKGMSARAISRLMECSITPVLKILRDIYN